ncbi:Golgin-80 [Operophtera brumata]|uniref:Golgin-80 n=1 Tax=Operophtera brumata TaxID=104452 RepID=A0A0L7KRL9_OPEBR|nr:Golgin-80 [Operophtera brumata]
MLQLKDHQDKKNQENIQKCDLDCNNELENDTLVLCDQDSSVIQINQDLTHSSEYSSEYKQNEYISADKDKVNATEFLISTKRNLELQIVDLQAKNTELENNVITTSEKYQISCQRVNTLENELNNINFNYNSAKEQLQMKDNLLKGLNDEKCLVLEEKNNLQEQLEFTKTFLTAKETENDSLHSQLFNIQSQLDATQLQLQQLTSGAHDPNKYSPETLRQENEILLQKVTSLEQQLKSQLKDYQQINAHYEHYVGELNEQLKSVTRKNEDLNREWHKLSKRETDLIEQIEELTQTKEFECKQSNEVSLLKLNADIASDKVAAQRATEQNKKLKLDLLGLEEALVKMTKDKLELTEKITAEKFLNRELTIKLAEIDEKSNNLHTTLKAKDEEMIRLQANYRDLERVYEELKQTTLSFKDNSNLECLNNNDTEITQDESKNEENDERKCHHNTEPCENRALIECSNDSASIPKGDAMIKLQQRFLKIMEEVADLSDEKHRLEHIIMQLQNETDTICEYVALYQQQRSLLKRRDEERSAQIKLFQSECNRLQSQLDELTGILKRFAEDKELSSYFQVQTKHEDIQKVMSLLSNLKKSSILDPHKTIEFTNFYPCSCCSGQLIEV